MEKVGTSQAVTADKYAFLLQEFNALRKEIEMEIKQLRDYLQAAILASGGIWAWFLSHPAQKLPDMAYFLPLTLSALLFLQTIGLRRKVFKLGSYIARIESEFHVGPKLGWETHLESGAIKRDSVTLWETVTWIFLCLANLLAALYITRRLFV